jgi:hypothetical protein
MNANKYMLLTLMFLLVATSVSAADFFAWNYMWDAAGELADWTQTNTPSVAGGVLILNMDNERVSQEWQASGEGSTTNFTCKNRLLASADGNCNPGWSGGVDDVRFGGRGGDFTANIDAYCGSAAIDNLAGFQYDEYNTWYLQYSRTGTEWWLYNASKELMYYCAGAGEHEDFHIRTDTAGTVQCKVDYTQCWNGTIADDPSPESAMNTIYTSAVRLNLPTDYYLLLTYIPESKYNTTQTIVATLELNNTNTSATNIAQTSTTATFYSQQTISDTHNVNKTHKWFVTLPLNGGGTETILSTPHNQTFYLLTIDNCSTNTVLVANITFYDEESPNTHINSTLQGAFDLYLGGVSFDTFTVNEYQQDAVSICLTLNNTVNVYARLYSIKEGLFTQRWYLVNATFTPNITQDIRVYNRESTIGTSNLLGTVRTPSYNYLRGVYATLERYYPDENTWRGVQMDKSDEFGQIFYNIIEESVDYRLRFRNENNRLYSTTNDMKFVCDSGVCEITFQVDTAAEATYGNVEYGWVYDNTTKVGELSFDDVTGVTSSVRLVVTQQGYGREVIICNESVVAASGSLTCNVSGYTGQIIVRAFSSASPETPLFIKFIFEKLEKLVDVIGVNDGMVWTMAITLTTIGAGLINPMAVVIGTILGLVFSAFIGLNTIFNYVFILAAASIGIIVALKLGGK